MNKRLKNLFNHGKNKGDMIIKSNTNDEIRCYSLIMEEMSAYFNLNEHALKKFDLRFKSLG